jgi:hypothetical protein
MEQSSPFHPNSQLHFPSSLHFPWKEQLFGHCFNSQNFPEKPGKHLQHPSTQIPLCEQLNGHLLVEQSTPIKLS